MASNYAELSNGQPVCTEHRLIICGACCVDYSFISEILDDGVNEPVKCGAADSQPESKKLATGSKRKRQAFSQ